MEAAKIDRLKALIEKDPRAAFPRYGLAMEYQRLGRLEDSLETFAALLVIDPSYLPAYFHFGAGLIENGREQEALSVLSRGASLAQEAGDTRTGDEIRSLLDDLE